MSQFIHRRTIILLGVFCGLIVAIGSRGETAVSAPPPEAPQSPTGSVPTLSISEIATGFDQAVDIAHANDKRLFIVERAGVIRVIENGTVLGTPFLDINGIVNSESHGEMGLLGLVFHPDYPDTPYFYVNYTATGGGDTVIARYTVSGDPNVADPNSDLELLRVGQPQGNHNAGDLAFGPNDGYLYIPLGDGGNFNDTGPGHNSEIGNAQDMTRLLGKLLRIDVDAVSGTTPDCGSIQGGGTPPYTIPDDNPFVDDNSPDDGICDEIWASGLRNPWRLSFDWQTGDMFIGDVGQGAREEVNYQPADSTGGENYGWRCYEGNNFTGFDDPLECDGPYEFPFFEYSHSNGIAVTGGFIYRGVQSPALQGHYIFADYGFGNIWLSQQNGSNWNTTFVGTIPGLDSPSTFGEGCDFELYVADYADGTIYHIQATGAGQAVVGGTLDEIVYLPIISNNFFTNCK